MSKSHSHSHSQIYVFGTTKVNLRQLVFFNCRLSKSITSLIEVSRAFKRSGETIALEGSNIKAAVFVPAKTVILHDIFLSESFGVSIKFKDDSGAFISEFSLKQPELLEITSADGKDIRLLSFVEADALKTETSVT